MSGVELALAFLAGVVMGGALDRFVLPLLVDAWIDRLRRHGSPVGTPSTHWWRYASRDRTHRSARDWQRYVVGKVLLSPQAAEDPGAGAG